MVGILPASGISSASRARDNRCSKSVSTASDTWILNGTTAFESPGPGADTVAGATDSAGRWVTTAYTPPSKTTAATPADTRRTGGEFNWSSQHLDDEVLRWRNGTGDGQTEQVGLRCVRPGAVE